MIKQGKVLDIMYGLFFREDWEAILKRTSLFLIGSQGIQFL